MRETPRNTASARRILALVASAAIVVTACSTASSPSPSTAGGGSAAPTTAASSAPASSAPSQAATPVTLNTIWMKQAAYSEDDVAGMIKAFTDANPSITVNTEFVPYEALHDKIVIAQSSGSGQYDTVLIDTPWPAEFADAKIVTDITDKIPAEFKSGVFDSAWTAATYNGKYWGVPWINDTKFFFYNQKMLTDAGVTSPPKTWDDVIAAAQAIKAKGTSNTRSFGAGPRPRRSSATGPRSPGSWAAPNSSMPAATPRSTPVAASPPSSS